MGDSATAKAESAVAKRGGSVVEYLIEEELLTRDLLGQVLAENKGVQYIDLRQQKNDVETKNFVAKRSGYLTHMARSSIARNHDPNLDH